MGVGPEGNLPADSVAEHHDVPSSDGPQRRSHSHAMDFADLQAIGRFVRDSRVGGMFHGGQVSLREDSDKESLHVSLGQNNRLSVHMDRYSPLAHRKSGDRPGYSVGRVIVHNVGIVVDYVTLLIQRRFGEQRCELECERICIDEDCQSDAPADADGTHL